MQNRIEAAAEGTSPSLARVGRWISTHPIRAVSHSAEEIAALTGTSVAAVNRFACAAGFEGFAHLKATLGDELQSVLEPLGKLREAVSDTQSAAIGRKGKATSAHIDAQALQRAADAPQIRRVAGRLIKAHQVLILGFGNSGYLAGYAAHALMPYLRSVWSVAGEGGNEEAARRLARCGRGDVLIAVSLPRYSRDTVRLARYARARGAHVVAVTNAAAAPLASVCHTLLIAPSDHPVVPSSVLGAVAVIEALAAAVVRLVPDAAHDAREMSEAVLSHLAFPTMGSHKSTGREDD